MIHRIINPLKSQSFFLFGARGTGKSTLLKQYLTDPHSLWIDLLDSFQEDELSRDPNALKKRIQAHSQHLSWVIIDEVQKVPKLLDIVHQLIESSQLKFALTGSSARKLKRGAANLLAGRAFMNHLYPLTHVEMGEHFSLDETLQWGALPKITQFTTNEEKREFLKSYALTYVKEEIWAEQIIRKINPFRKFLEVAAQCNGEPLNYSNIAKDVGADVKTVQSYYQVLEDTLVGFHLPAFHRSIRKQQREAPKFYFFDIGVKRALEGALSQTPVPNTYGYGKLFEHFLLLEIFRLNEYFKKDYRFSYLLTKEGAEIDLIIERPGLSTVLIEIKSSNQVDERDTRVVQRFLKDFNNTEGFCLSRDPIAKKIESVWTLPWKEGLKELGFV